MPKPLILVTNDDGVDAPGLLALAAALAEEGDVWVVAPDRERSACSQSLTVDRQLRPERTKPCVFRVDGTPADCVKLALSRLLPRRPALVASGINRGPNLGDDIFYSGTVGGAREATFFGVPAIAVSLAASRDLEYGPAAAVSRQMARLVLERGLPERTLLNVNVPPGQPTGVVLTRQGHHDEPAARNVGSQWVAVSGDPPAEPAIADLFAVQSGLVSVTPLVADTTHHGQLATFRQWTLDLASRVLA